MAMTADQNDLFSWIDEARRTAGADRAFEELVDRFKRDKQYGSVFNARLMKSRLTLGLPLTSHRAIADVPADLQQQYQDAYLEAAREVGELLLADGNIPGAWPYFRAVGNVKPVAEALETFHADRAGSADADEHLGQVIQLAFYEGVNPQKGFELAVQHYGICRAITMFSAYPSKSGRDESLRLLVGTLHAEIVENLKRAISAVEGATPDTDSIARLLQDRAWLFENNAQYTDSSHLAGLLRFTGDLEDETALRQAIEIADYGTHLSPIFQYSDNPPFDRAYEDRGIYLRALIGEDVERAIAHFEAKAAACDPEFDGTRPAEVLVDLLCRLERHSDAIRAFRQFLSNAIPEDLSCPTLPQLCELAGDFELLRQVAKEQSDPLSYLAGAIKADTKKS
jgi:hypothetical protein